MTIISRRLILGAALVAGARSVLPAHAQSADAAPRFGFDDVVRRAHDLAAAPFEDKPAPPPAPR